MTQQRNAEFDWHCYPDAASVVTELLRQFIDTIPMAANLASRMHDETGTRFVDWVDHLCLPESHDAVNQLSQCGFEATAADGELIWKHVGGMFPAIRVRALDAMRLAIKTESVADFLFKHRICSDIEGQPNSQLRMARVRSTADSENFGSSSGMARSVFTFPTFPPGRSYRRYTTAKPCCGANETLISIRRVLIRPANWFVRQSPTSVSIGHAICFLPPSDNIGRVEIERCVQKSRQDGLGLGWANHGSSHVPKQPRELHSSDIAAGRTWISVPRTILRRC